MTLVLGAALCYNWAKATQQLPMIILKHILNQPRQCVWRNAELLRDGALDLEKFFELLLLALESHKNRDSWRALDYYNMTGGISARARELPPSLLLKGPPTDFLAQKMDLWKELVEVARDLSRVIPESARHSFIYTMKFHLFGFNRSGPALSDSRDLISVTAFVSTLLGLIKSSYEFYELLPYKVDPLRLSDWSNAFSVTVSEKRDCISLSKMSGFNLECYTGLEFQDPDGSLSTLLELLANGIVSFRTTLSDGCHVYSTLSDDAFGLTTRLRVSQDQGYQPSAPVICISRGPYDHRGLLYYRGPDDFPVFDFKG